MGLLRAGHHTPVFLGDTWGRLGLGWVAPTVLHGISQELEGSQAEFAGKCAVGDKNTDPPVLDEGGHKYPSLVKCLARVG